MCHPAGFTAIHLGPELFRQVPHLLVRGGRTVLHRQEMVQGQPCLRGPDLGDVVQVRIQLRGTRGLGEERIVHEQHRGLAR